MQNTNTVHQQKMLDIVEKYTPEIYNSTDRLSALIKDFFPQEEIANLLKIVIKNKGSLEIYKLQNLSGNNLNVSYQQVLDSISSKTYISKDVLSPAINLLCVGVGIDVSGIPNTTTQTQNTPSTQQSQTQTPKPSSVPKPAPIVPQQQNDVNIWDKTKNFVKDNKTELMVGAVVAGIGLFANNKKNDNGFNLLDGFEEMQKNFENMEREFEEMQEDMQKDLDDMWG